MKSRLNRMNITLLKKEFNSKKWLMGAVLQKKVPIEIINIGIRYANNTNRSDPIVEVLANIDEQGDSFEVTIQLTDDELLHASCNCNGENGYGYYNWSSDYCEHVAATLIETCAKIEQGSYDMYTDRNAHILVQLYTKDAITDTKITSELVTLEPILNVNGNEWSISFKIGRDKKYVIRNLTNFYNLMQHNENFSYGKDFEILHTRNMFDTDSKQLLDFIFSKVEEAGTLPVPRRYNFDVSIGRDISLTPHNITEFMSYMINKKISYTLVDEVIGKKIKGIATVLRKNPNLQLDIIPEYSKNDELLGVQLDIGEVIMFDGNNAMYQLTQTELYISDTEFAKILSPFINVVTNEGTTRFKIGKRLLSSFYEDILPKLSTCMQINEVDTEKIRATLPLKVDFKFYFDRNSKNEIVCNFEALCGDLKLDFFNEQQAVKYSFFVRQTKIMILLDKYIDSISIDNLITFVKDDDLEYDFLAFGSELLSEYGELHVTESFKHVSIKSKSNVTVGVQLKSDLLELTVETDDFELNELKDILSSYNQKKKYHKLKNGSFLAIEDETIGQLSDLIDGLHIPFKDLAKGKLQTPAYRALYIDRVLQDNNSIAYERNKKFKHLVRDFRSIEDSDYDVPTQVKSILRNYQKTGYRWLRTLQTHKLNGILADDMGLGKTLQVITLLLSLKDSKQSKTSIVISPASLVYNWENEFSKFAPDLSIGIVAGTAADRKNVIEQSHLYDVIITSYDLLKRDIEYYENKMFFYEVIDEAQYIKNHTTLVSKSVKIIRATHKLALTGTPIENRLSELWSIFDYLMPGFLYTYEKFRKEIESPIVKAANNEIASRLKKLVAPFILRRLKKDVLKDLPSKLEEITFAKMEDEQRKLYVAYVDKFKQELNGQADGEFEKNKLKILAELTRLRQICCDPSLVYDDYKGGSAKLETCMELIENAIDGGHKILLFSQFTSMFEIVEKRLINANISYYKLTGATPKAKRLKLVDEFNENDIPIFLISLKAGGTGLNLTGADVVIHYDPWWNVAAQNQATDRAHRIGQTSVVTVFKLIAKGTIEEKILEMQEKKQQLADQIISGEANQLGTMTKDDFMDLFND